MVDQRYVVSTVECQYCKTKQSVHVAPGNGAAEMGDQVITCIGCKRDFVVMVPDKIIAGPFPDFVRPDPAS
jgi:hypothetical protein